LTAKESANSLSEFNQDSEPIKQDNGVLLQVLADEARLKSLQDASTTALILGVSKRKLKSLQFRLRRRDIKVS
jgi:hypothetical protein